jgi:hypothetical protein
VNKRQNTSRKELGDVTAAPVGKAFRIPNHHPGEFLKRAFGLFHGVDKTTRVTFYADVRCCGVNALVAGNVQP